MNNHWLLNLQWIVQRKLSQWIGILFDCQWSFVKNPIIWLFIKRYGVDLSEYHYASIKDYKSVNAFFIRKLKNKSRMSADEQDVIIAPVDGYISQVGIMTGQTLVQAKQSTYNLSDLLAGEQALVKLFEGGHFINLYLAPEDYHRVHMPLSGTLQQMLYVPGWLFSVNPRNTERVSQLFTRNERVISIFKTPTGAMAIVQVGALLVGSIATAWKENIVSRTRKPKIQKWNYHNQNYSLQRMSDMGHFKMGSTVIVLFTKGQVTWDETLHPNQRVRFTQVLGKIKKSIVIEKDQDTTTVASITAKLNVN